MSGDCDLCGSYAHVEGNCDANEPQDPTEPRMVVRSVPASIPRSRVLTFLTELGIDPMKVERDGGIRIGWDAIRCRVIAEDEHGEPYVDETGPSIATHDVCIPLVEETP